jgi:hypothetical protein
MKAPLTLAALPLLALVPSSLADQGNPNLAKIESIAFGPNGYLLIGGGAKVVIVATGDTTPVKWTQTEIPKIDELLAGKLGMEAKDIEFRKLAVNPVSNKAYVALQSLTKKTSLILVIDGAGRVSELPLDNVRYKSYALAAPKTAITKITDLAWADGKIVVATEATDVFGSRVFTIDPTDKSGPPVQVSTKTFHVGHGKWETKAPFRTLMPLVEGGKTSVVGSFTCTPIVRYDLEEAKDDDQITGRSVVELGTGNTPRSMFAYERGGKNFLLVNVGRFNKKPAFDFPSAYWAARVDATLLNETTNINENAPWRVGGKSSAGDRVAVARDYFGVQQMDRLDANRALAIVESEVGFNLRILPLP